MKFTDGAQSNDSHASGPVLHVWACMPSYTGLPNPSQRHSAVTLRQEDQIDGDDAVNLTLGNVESVKMAVLSSSQATAFSVDEFDSTRSACGM